LRRLAILLLVLLVLLVVADRVALVVAERTTASKLAAYGQFEAKPSVHIGGFPFLTQAVRGSYDDVEIKSDAVTLGEVPRAKLDVRLRGAKIPLNKLSGGPVSSLPVDQVSGTVELTYADLARLSSVAGLTFGPAGRLLAVSGQVSLPVVGAISVHGTAAVAVQSDRVRVTVKSLDVGGVSASGPVLAAVSAAIADAIDIPPLPYGLKIQSVQVAGTGLVVTGGAEHITLTRP
jgi:LmeA-like phospholipid-binding